MALVASLGVAVTVGFWLPQDDYFELRKNFRIFGAVYENLVTGYAERIDPGHLRRVGVEAMLSELDPYTTFLDEGDNTEIDIMTRGHYGGVGLNVGTRNGRITVTGPVEGAGAYRQGVRAGDVVTEVDGQPTSSLVLEDVERLLRGEPGTTVHIAVKRAGEPAPLEFTLTRRKIDPANVTYRGRIGPDGDVGYVKLERFGRGTGSELSDALETITESGELGGFVLDLRGNPGGLLRAAVDVADLFLPENREVVSTKGRLPRANNTYRSTRPSPHPDLSLVVLVDRYSASASEIVAGAIQDHDRGVVMGTTTYGKGLVQAVRSLPHNTSLKMTTAQYYTPSGRSIQSLTAPDSSAARAGGPVPRSHETTHGRTVRDGEGLHPDVRVPPDDTSAVEVALRRRAAFFFYANHFAARRDSLPVEFSVTDTILTDFRTWLDDEDIRYPTDAERAIEKLEQRFEGQDYEAVNDEVEALRAAVVAQKDAAFQDHASSLKRQLEREIRARFVDEARVTQAMLPHDKQVTAAVDLLHDVPRYDELLAPVQDP